MSQSQQLNEIQIDRDVRIPMRDGVRLSAEVYRPQGEGKWPVIVTREGYTPEDPYQVGWAKFFSRRGYV